MKQYMPAVFEVKVIDSHNVVVWYYGATFNVSIFDGNKRKVIKSPVRFNQDDYNRLIATVLTAVETFEMECSNNERNNR